MSSEGATHGCTGNPCTICFPPGPGVLDVHQVTWQWTGELGAPTLKGWECPRCGAVNAPLVSQCTCRPNMTPPLVPPAPSTLEPGPYWPPDLVIHS